MSRTATHDAYDALCILADDLSDTLREFRELDGGAFEWEADEAAKLVGQARRYLSKPGEVLYCNWTYCLHAEGEDVARSGKTDKRGRALAAGEGVQWFKGHVHPDCMKALRP